MQQPEFEEAVQEQVSRSTDMLLNKNHHYNPGQDKLASFKRAARMKGISTQDALSGMMIKHTTSVYDLCAVPDVTSISIEVWNEKITDHINYLLLLRAVVQEEFDAKQSDEALAALREKLTETPSVSQN